MSGVEGSEQIEYCNYVMNKRKDVKRLSKAKGSRWLQYENIKIPVCKELIAKTFNTLGV